MTEKIYNLKNDVIFKAFFTGKDGEEFLSEFLSSLLKVKITDLKVREEVNLEQLSVKEKGGRLDLQATIDGKTMVNIELQIKEKHNMWKRTLLYAGKTLSRETEKGTKYNDVKKLIIITILGYNMFKYDEYINKTAIVLDKHRECEVMNDIQWYYIELPKFRKQKPNMDEKVNQWIALIDDDKELIKMAETKNKTMKKAREKINYLTGDKATRRLAELREMWEFDYNSEMYYAREEGLAKRNKRAGKKSGIKERNKRTE